MRDMTGIDIHHLTQARNAQITVGPSAIRGQPEGTKKAAVKYLKNLDLKDFQNVTEKRFKEILDEKTGELQKELPSNSWGMARKIMNIFLIQCFHDKYLSEKYQLDGIIDFMELPLDNKNAKKIKEEADNEWKQLPRWINITSLKKTTCEKYQECAKEIAKKKGIERYQLDLCWWREEDNSAS